MNGSKIPLNQGRKQKTWKRQKSKRPSPNELKFKIDGIHFEKYGIKWFLDLGEGEGKGKTIQTPNATQSESRYQGESIIVPWTEPVKPRIRRNIIKKPIASNMALDLLLANTQMMELSRSVSLELQKNALKNARATLTAMKLAK